MTNPAYATNTELVGQVVKRKTVENIAHLASEARALGIPVFHTTVAAYEHYHGWSANSLLTGVFRKRPLVVGNPAVDIHPLLTPTADDHVIERHRGITAFHGTELEYLLRNLGISSVIMTGVSANVAVNGSCIEAVNRGFTAVVPADCVSGATDETHDFMLENIIRLVATITTSSQLIEDLRGESDSSKYSLMS
ncbi:MAG: cysteine hydrolase [Gordonia sp.]|nr:cysteine hydrolase [Gordonia sp. (in: high G+C Gram-positive bacteria)]